MNDQAGYLFSYPDSWDLYTSGETDDLVSPGEDIKVSFGVAPPGPLRQASNGVLGRLTDAYSNVELVSDRVERTEQGQRGLVTGATATDANGAFVRLMAIIIRGPGSEPIDHDSIFGELKPFARPVRHPADRRIVPHVSDGLGRHP